MKKFLTFSTAVLLMASVFAQSPEKMSYQAVIRDASDNLITDTQIGMQISILQGSASGTAVYVETQSPTTNANGLVSLEIGVGTVVSGDFATIDWANGPYFIKTETAVEAPLTTYTITGTSQLLSVPYALHAKTAESVTGGITETDPSVPIGTQIGEMQYWNGTAWVTVAATENEGATLQMIGGIPTWVGGTPPTPNVTNPTTGEIWMDRNLGASQVATSSTDANAYGDLYQWGRAADGHESRTSATTSTNATSAVPNDGNAWDGFFITEGSSPYDWLTPQDDNLWQGVSGTNNPCPSGYRLPTEAEWEAERTSWSSNNAAGAFASPLKLPVAGIRYSSDGSLLNVGSYGSYWSSTVDGTNSRYLYFNSSSAYMNSYSRAYGRSVRCLKD
jgi:uncharacterized protein (TIGR02145 family)